MEPISLGLLLGSTALSVGGNLLRGQGVAEGNNRAFGPGGPLDAERYRQQNFTNEANAITQRELGRFDDFPGQMGTAATRASDFFRDNRGALPTTGGPTAGTVPVSTSSAVVNDAAGKNAKVAAFNDQQNGALAGLRSFGDAFGDVDRGLASDRSDLANIASFRRGSQSILPLEMQAAGYAGGDKQQFGDILGGFGRIGTNLALTGAPARWFGNAAVPTGPAPGITFADALASGIAPL